MIRMTKRTVLMLNDEAVAIIENNASERKKGEWASNAIIAYAKALATEDKGITERIEARLERIEALLIANSRQAVKPV